MKTSRKTKTALAVLISLAIVLSLYTALAHIVASYIYEHNSTLYWPTPSYTFLPWPTIPTGLVSQMTVPLNQTDLQYYQYIIKSGILIALTLLLWVIIFWKVWRLRASHNLNDFLPFELEKHSIEILIRDEN